jgi:hypothetical protein
MATNFLDAPGTNGFIATPFNLLTTEINTLGSGSAATSSVGGTSGVFNQTNFANGIWGSIYFTSGGAFTPTTGQALLGWFLISPDGGTTFESVIATPSTTVAALSRTPDFVIPLDNAAFASGNIRWAQGRYVKLPWESCKILVQNTGTTALPASGNIIKCGPVAVQY